MYVMKIKFFERFFLFSVLALSLVSPVLADTPPVPAPSIQVVSPISGATVAQHSGTIALKWNALPGSHCYHFTIQFNAYGSWMPVAAADGSTCKTASGTMTLDPYFLRQYGPAGVALRWRVWTADKNTTSISSDWISFTFKATGNVSFKNPPVDMRKIYGSLSTRKKHVKKKPTTKKR